MYNMNISEMGGYAAYRKVYQNFDNLNQDNKNYENTRSADADMGAVSQRDRISKRDTVEISAAGKSAFTESLNADLDLPEASNENADARTRTRILRTTRKMRVKVWAARSVSMPRNWRGN